MAGLNFGNHGGKKSLDSEVPLVPFIDLLLCCVMFLLATAVWNNLSRIETKSGIGPERDMVVSTEDSKLVIEVGANGYLVSSSLGDSFSVPKNANGYDVIALAKQLDIHRQLEPERTSIVVAGEDGIPYSEMVIAMDLVISKGFDNLRLADAATI